MAASNLRPQPLDLLLALFLLSQQGIEPLFDLGRLQDGEPHLAATARIPQAFVNVQTARAIGVEQGNRVTITTDRGSVTLPVAIGEVADGVVWLPLNSPGTRALADLGVAGSVVTVTSTAADTDIEAEATAADATPADSAASVPAEVAS